MRASTNPLAYFEGGFLGGHLKPTKKIKPLLTSDTASFGITALNELQELYNGKSLVEMCIRDRSQFPRIAWDIELDCKGNLLMPGFKNAHTHSGMTLSLIHI